MISASDKGTKLVFNGDVSQPSLSDNGGGSLNLNTTIANLEADKPITMFPIRLETKYLENPASVSGYDLWIRIFPDQILAKTHEAKLTGDEYVGGQNYWTVLNEEQDDASTLVAWTKLCKDFGIPRAAYIIKITKPEITHTGSALNDAKAIYDQLNNDIEKYLDGSNRDPKSLDYLKEVRANVQDAWNFIKSLTKAPLLLTRELQSEIDGFQINLETYYNRTLNPWKDIVTQAEIDREGLDPKTVKLMPVTGLDADGEREFIKGPRPYARQDRTDPVLTDLKKEIDTFTQDSIDALFDYGVVVAGTSYVWPKLIKKTEYYSEQPYTDMLPDTFVAVGMNETDTGLNVAFIKEGKSVPVDLKVGPQPMNKDTPDSKAPFKHIAGGELDFDASLSWMFDLDAAEDKGMAIKIVGANEAYDKVVVFGVKSGTIQGATTALEELFKSHQYTKGLSLLEIGTDTNNTIENQSAFSQNDEDYAKWHEIYSGVANFTFDSKKDATNGQRIAEALGLDFDVFDHLENGDSNDISEAKVMKKVLFPATLGHHMEEMLGNILNEDNRVRVRKFFEDWATARGAVPSFRIGEQPYGVHLASRLHAFEIQDEDKVLDEGTVDSGNTDDFDEDPGEYSYSRLTRNDDDPYFTGIVESNFVIESDFNDIDDLHKKADPSTGSSNEFTNINTGLRSDDVWQKRFDVRFKELLKFMDLEWRKVAEKTARNVYLKNIEDHNPNDPRAHFMEIFSRQAHSTKYGLRYISTTGTWNSILSDQSGVESPGEFIDRWAEIASVNQTPELKNFLLEPLDDLPQDPNIDETYTGPRLPLGIYSYSDTVKADPDHPKCLNNPTEYVKKINGTVALRLTNSPEIEMLDGDIVNNGEIGDPGNDGSLHQSTFINDLLTTDPKLLYNDNAPANSPNSVAYLLTKQAMLLKYREISTRILIAEGVTDWASVNRLGHMESVTGDLETQEGIHTYTGDTSDNSQIKPLKWFYTKWNVLFDKLYGKYMYMLNSSELSPADIFNRYDGIKASYVYWKLRNFDDDNTTMPWGLDIDGNIDPEYAVSKWRYDQNDLVKYLRPYDNPNANPAKNPYSDNDDYERTFYRAFFGLDKDQNSTGSTELGFFDDFKLDGNEDFYEASDDPSINGGKTMSDYLFQIWNDPTIILPITPIEDHTDLLDEFLVYKNELAKLGSMSTEKYATSMAETVDLSTYRLDGWIQGLYAQRLDELRHNNVPKGSRGNSGSHIGAFGYIEKLSRTGADDITTSKKEATNVPADLDNGTVYTDAKSDGFIMTPSITHAVTASILRSGYLTSFALENSEVHNRLSVNLSSKRVRQALDLLSSVRSGQELGAVLGFQFEKGLHERSEGTNQLDVYIHRIRKRFPLHRAGSEINEDQEPIRSGEVLDGLALVDHILDSSNDLGLNETIYSAYVNAYNDFGLNDAEDKLVPPNGDAYKLYLFELNELIQAFDALADLVVSEGVFQIAGGNFDRASAFLNTMTGNRAIIDPEVIDIQRTGNSFYNKLAINFESVANHVDNVPAKWGFNRDVTSTQPLPGMARVESVMSILEPSLNKWLGEVIGDPKNIIVNVDYGADGNLQSDKISLADLKIQPILLMQILAVNPVKGSSDLSARLSDALRRKLGLRLDEIIKIKYTEKGTGDEISLYEFLPLLNALREILNNAGYLGANDFEVNQPVGENNLGGYDIVDLKSRMTEAINIAKIFLINLPADLGSINIDTLIEISDQFGEYGILGAIPKSVLPGLVDDHNEPLGEDDAKLLTYLNAVNSGKLVLQNRYDAAKAINDLTAGLTDEATVVENINKSARTLYGKTFRVLPAFTLRDAQDVLDAIAGKDDLFPSAKSKSDSINSWVHSLARVRKTFDSFESYRTFSEILNFKKDNLDAIQIPYNIGDHWLGGDYPDGWKPGSKVNVVISDVGAIPSTESQLASAKLVGLKVDDWQDTIPDRDVTAGIAFNYNAPNTEPAQTLIQAIPTKVGIGAGWSIDDVLYTIIETMDMAKYRVIDTDDIVANNNWLGKMLPGATFEAFPMYDASKAGTAGNDDEGTGMRFDPAFKKNND